MDNIRRQNNFKLEQTTAWSFPERGTWYTHSAEYRGNFAPQIPRNVILRYSNEEDTILDPMVGCGTTLIETKILNRSGLGIDINPNAIELTKKNLNFPFKSKCEQDYRIGDVRNLNFIESESIDLIITHPPYLNIIQYSKDIEGDLSRITNVREFCGELEKGIEEFYRVLKEDSYCAILIGDTRKSRHYIPLSFYIMRQFLKHGFALKEDIIKIQHHCDSTPYWKQKSEKYNIYLIMHEHLFIFRKPRRGENLNKIEYSVYNSQY